jgi:chemotaxis protein MotB
MARRHQHEEHVNHEAWAIPYGDLITLLLAFFVVMYAVSSINEGKYRVLADSLAAAFHGSPKTMQPIQIGEKQVGSGADIKLNLVQQGMLEGYPKSLFMPPPLALGKDPYGTADTGPRPGTEPQQLLSAQQRQLMEVAYDVEAAMADLIEENLVAVRRHRYWVEVEIRTDILFPSGVARLSPQAEVIIRRLADVLRSRANPIRVEGHTDNVPINTVQFRSNWELSAARAGSVVHLFTEAGLDPARLAVVGLGEYRPVAPNDTPAGRNANRRVVLVILGVDTGAPEGDYANDRGDPSVAETAPVAPVHAMATTANIPR